MLEVVRGYMAHLKAISPCELARYSVPHTGFQWWNGGFESIETEYYMLLAKVDTAIREGVVSYLDGEILRISCSSYPNDPIGGFESSFVSGKGRTFHIRVQERQINRKQ